MPPLADYDELTASEVKSQLEELSAGELQAVKAHEEEHEHRQSVLGEIGCRLR
jgi:hypothetical protein